MRYEDDSVCGKLHALFFAEFCSKFGRPGLTMLNCYYIMQNMINRICYDRIDISADKAKDKAEERKYEDI